MRSVLEALLWAGRPDQPFPRFVKECRRLLVGGSCRGWFSQHFHSYPQIETSPSNMEGP